MPAGVSKHVPYEYNLHSANHTEDPRFYDSNQTLLRP